MVAIKIVTEKEFYKFSGDISNWKEIKIPQPLKSFESINNDVCYFRLGRTFFIYSIKIGRLYAEFPQQVLDRILGESIISLKNWKLVRIDDKIPYLDSTYVNAGDASYTDSLCNNLFDCMTETKDVLKLPYYYKEGSFNLIDEDLDYSVPISIRNNLDTYFKKGMIGFPEFLDRSIPVSYIIRKSIILKYILTNGKKYN